MAVRRLLVKLKEMIKFTSFHNRKSKGHQTILICLALCLGLLLTESLHILPIEKATTQLVDQGTESNSEKEAEHLEKEQEDKFPIYDEAINPNLNELLRESVVKNQAILRTQEVLSPPPEA